MEQKTAKRFTHKTPSSRHTDKQALRPEAREIPRMPKRAKATDNNWPQSLLVVYLSVKPH